jgi:hypothetical protein
MSVERAFTRAGLTRSLAAVLLLIFAAACRKDSGSGPSPSDYSGSWSGLQPHSTIQVGTGVLLTISGQTITSATVETENYFGAVPQPGCLLAFTASGPVTISGNSFVLPLSLASNPIAGISALTLASSGTFTSNPMLQGTFTSSTAISGQLSYAISSATCGGTTYTGAVPTAGFGNQIRAFTATR